MKIEITKLNGNIETLELDELGWRNLKAAMLDNKRFFNHIVHEQVDSSGTKKVVKNRWYNLEQIDHIDVKPVNKETMAADMTMKNALKNGIDTDSGLGSTTRTSMINTPKDNHKEAMQKSLNAAFGLNGFAAGKSGRNF